MYMSIFSQILAHLQFFIFTSLSLDSRYAT